MQNERVVLTEQQVQTMEKARREESIAPSVIGKTTISGSSIKWIGLVLSGNRPWNRDKNVDVGPTTRRHWQAFISLNPA